MPLHLLVGAGNSLDPSPARLRYEAKRGAQWRRRPQDRGGDRTDAAVTAVSSDTTRSNGKLIDKRKGKGQRLNTLGEASSTSVLGSLPKAVLMADRVPLL
jgi:hypothetical protein